MAGVFFRDVRKTYGKLEVIHGVTTDVADGEFVVIVGPSGCGKSTLLRMVAGLERISSGEIAIGERVVNDLEPKDRDIAMVFQNYALYPHMTVERNMGFALEQAKTPRSEIAETVRRNSLGGVFPCGRTSSISGSQTAHAASVKISHPLLSAIPQISVQ